MKLAVDALGRVELTLRTCELVAQLGQRGGTLGGAAAQLVDLGQQVVQLLLFRVLETRWNKK